MPLYKSGAKKKTRNNIEPYKLNGKCENVSINRAKATI